MQEQKNHREVTPDEKKVQSFNFWYAVLIAFIVAWVVGAYIYLNNKTDRSIHNPPVVVLDAADGMVISNLFKIATTNNQLLAGNPYVEKGAERFISKEKYDFGDVVVVKFFYVEAVIVEKSSTSDQYTIIYKDHNYVLQKISLPKEMLLYPRDGVLNPVSLLVD